jgi:hypothetical protein
MSRDNERRWNQPHRSQIFVSVNPDTPSDISVNVDKSELGSVDKDETESDEVGDDEDTNEDVQVKRYDESSYLPGTSLGNNDDDEDDEVGGNKDNSDDMGEDESVEEVIVTEDKVGGDETITKKQQQHHDTWVNNYNKIGTFYNMNGHCIAKHNVDTAEGKKLGNWCMTSARNSRQEHWQMIEYRCFLSSNLTFRCTQMLLNKS